MVLVVLGALAAVPTAVSAQTPENTVRADVQTNERPRISASAAMEYATRNLSIDYGDGRIDFQAPMYPGLEVAVEVFPIAFFARNSPAAGLSLGFDTAKHKLNTVTDIQVDGEDYALGIPTRHDATSWHLRFDWRASSRASIVPSVSWRTIEYSLGRNNLLSNTFYRGLEVAVAGRYRFSRGFDAGIGLGVRPAVSLGSTAAPFGDDAGGLGLRAELDARYRMKFGMFVGAGVRYLRYSTTWKIDGTESATGTDGFLSFLFALGYSI